MSRKGGGGMAQASASFRFCRHERGKGKRQQAGKGLHHHPLTSFQVDHSHGNENATQSDSVVAFLLCNDDDRFSLSELKTFDCFSLSHENAVTTCQRREQETVVIVRS